MVICRIITCFILPSRMQRYIPWISCKSVVISNNGKRIIQLKDFAEVSVKEAIEFTKINANGRESILVGDHQTTQCQPD